MASVKNLKVEIQKGTTRTVFASWTFSEDHVAHYKVVWTYSTGNHISFAGTTDEVAAAYKNSIYTPPENAIAAKATVTPVAKKHKVKGKDTAYWSGTAKSFELVFNVRAPEKPDTPSISIDDKGQMTITGRVPNPNRLQMYVYAEIRNGGKLIATVKKDCTSSLFDNPVEYKIVYSEKITNSGTFDVRVRAYNTNKDSQVYGPYSDYSDKDKTIPGKVTNIVSIKAKSPTCASIDWDPVKSAETYIVEYADQRMYFDSSTQVGSVTVKDPIDHAEVTGLESGKTWWFRIKAANSKGEGPPSDFITLVLGETPSAPTAWTYNTTAMLDEEISIYFVHNSIDNSDLSAMELEVEGLGGSSKPKQGISQGVEGYKPWEEIAKKKGTNQIYTYKYTIDSDLFSDVKTIQWHMRTCGITGSMGPWTDWQTISIYDKATNGIEITGNYKNGTLYAFPLKLNVELFSTIQTPIGQAVVIKSLDSYNIVTLDGTVQRVPANSIIYDRYFVSTKNPWTKSLSVDDVQLQPDCEYELTVTTSTQSGFSAVAQETFYTEWADSDLEPDGAVTIDYDTLSAAITPYCMVDGQYSSNVLLSVYRINYNGSLTEIVKDISNSGYTTVIDPHPSLNTVRYRIVATDKKTSESSFTDLPDYPVDIPEVIIQWEDSWNIQDYDSEDAPEETAVSTIMLRLPYNISVSEQTAPESNLVDYIGRTSPVSYYGTQENQSATWSVDIPYDDRKTLMLIRRLMTYMGDVYVREPSGTGYWANVNVQYSTKYNTPLIPITLTIKKVEGGV